ncbi:hypothetical protein [Colidextribacter sp. OB.20]|uniref:hypothetical protein n=1 Tax=Colidextribacter sp. OB.20 TaxID=2304568 RepID=UPI001367F60B|nr:hypothetical protein [Colidextribacter sp. OB.20]
MMHPTNPTGYFNAPEPPLDEPEPVWDELCQVCGCRLNIFDPAPLCGVCARIEEEAKWQ